MKRKDLAVLSVRNWSTPSTYDAVCLVPSGKKHDSGWHLIAIVGINGETPVEIAGYCDDISWHGDFQRVRTDMYFPSGVARMWGNGLCFTVGHSLSSMDITVNRKPKHEV
jgi:hypothetical protein